MPYPALGEALLGQVDDTYYYAATCTDCKKTVRLSLDRLRVELGADYPVMRIRQRLKCRHCGSRRKIVSYLTPEHCVGPFVEMFQELAI